MQRSVFFDAIPAAWLFLTFVATRVVVEDARPNTLEHNKHVKHTHGRDYFSRYRHRQVFNGERRRRIFAKSSFPRCVIPLACVFSSATAFHDSSFHVVIIFSHHSSSSVSKKEQVEKISSCCKGIAQHKQTVVRQFFFMVHSRITFSHPGSLFCSKSNHHNKLMLSRSYYECTRF